MYVEKKTMLSNRYCLSLLITSGVNAKKRNTPIVGITIGCKITDMNL